MRISKTLSTALIAATSIFTMAPAAALTNITFFQSTQLTHTRIASYTPGAGSSTLTIMGSSATGNPVLGVGLTLLKAAYQPAPMISLPVDFSFTATTVAMAVNTGVQFEQPGFNGTLSYTWFDPMLGATVNLLTAVFTQGTLNINLGGNPAGSFFNSSPLQTIVYTSDVFDLTAFAQEDFSLGFSAITNQFAVGSGYGVAFRSNVVATFAVAAIPEPSTWAMLIAGFGMVGFASRRRRQVRHVSA